MAPAGLDADLRDRLIAALHEVAADPAFIEECRRNGYTLGWRFGADFGQYMKQDDEQFGKVIRGEAAAT